MRATTLAAVATVAAALAISAAAYADTNNDEVWIGGMTRALRSSSANALTASNLTGGSIGIARDVGHDLGLSLHPSLGLWLEAGFAGGSADGAMFESLSTTINAIDLTLGVAARYRLLSRITASVRLAVGAQRVRVAIDAPGLHTYDHAWGAMSSVSASLDLFAFARPPFGLGLRLDAGYLRAQSLAMAPHPDDDEAGDTLQLAMTSAGIGHLDLSGPTVSISLLGQF